MHTVIKRREVSKWGTQEQSSGAWSGEGQTRFRFWSRHCVHCKSARGGGVTSSNIINRTILTLSRRSKRAFNLPPCLPGIERVTALKILGVTNHDYRRLITMMNTEKLTNGVGGLTSRVSCSFELFIFLVDIFRGVYAI